MRMCERKAIQLEFPEKIGGNRKRSVRFQGTEVDTRLTGENFKELERAGERGIHQRMRVSHLSVERERTSTQPHP